MTTELYHRTQIISNARLLIRPGDSKTSTTIPSISSQSTLTVPPSATGELDVTIFGASGEYVAAVIVGLTPVIEGESATTPEAALRRLYLATAELLQMYIPKVGSHQRNIHGGGIFNEEMISQDLMEAQKKSP